MLHRVTLKPPIRTNKRKQMLVSQCSSRWQSIERRWLEGLQNLYNKRILLVQVLNKKQVIILSEMNPQQKNRGQKRKYKPLLANGIFMSSLYTIKRTNKVCFQALMMITCHLIYSLLQAWLNHLKKEESITLNIDHQQPRVTQYLVTDRV